MDYRISNVSSIYHQKYLEVSSTWIIALFSSFTRKIGWYFFDLLDEPKAYLHLFCFAFAISIMRFNQVREYSFWTQILRYWIFHRCHFADGKLNVWCVDKLLYNWSDNLHRFRVHCFPASLYSDTDMFTQKLKWKIKSHKFFQRFKTNRERAAGISLWLNLKRNLKRGEIQQEA